MKALKDKNFRTEISAGLTTFMTVAYILAVHPSILSTVGMDSGALFTTTALTAAIGTFIMAFVAKLPFVVIPAMGANAFFVYTICTRMGFSWQFALTAVFLEGLIFLLLTLTGLRVGLVNLIPQSLKNALTAGIGLYITLVGLQNAGIVVPSESTMLTLGDIASAPAIVSIIGLIILGALYALKVRGAMIYGIIATTIVSIPFGLVEYKGVFSMPPSIEPIFMKQEWGSIFTVDMFFVLLSLLFVDTLSTIGAFIGMADKAGILQREDSDKIIKKGLLADAVATTVGAIMGTSSTCTAIESGAGLSAGARSGVASFVIAVCFLLALFFSPLFLMIPSAATAPVLIIIGLMMFSSVVSIDFLDYSEAIPAFICTVMMPLSYNIADGIILGLISYVLINLLSGKVRKLSWGLVIITAIFALKYVI